MRKSMRKTYTLKNSYTTNEACKILVETAWERRRNTQDLSRRTHRYCWGRPKRSARIVFVIRPVSVGSEVAPRKSTGVQEHPAQRDCNPLRALPRPALSQKITGTTMRRHWTCSGVLDVIHTSVSGELWRQCNPSAAQREFDRWDTLIWRERSGSYC